METGRADPAGRERSDRRQRRRLRARVRRPGSGRTSRWAYSGKFDPAANQWTQLPSNPVPVHHGAAAATGHKFYVFGGFRLPDTGKVGWYPENKAWVFDMDKGAWSALPSMPTRAGRSPGSGRKKILYVSGGAKIPAGMSLPDGLSGGGRWSCSARSRCSTPRPTRGSR